MTPLPAFCRIAPTDWPAVAAGFDDLTYEQTGAYAAAAAARVGAAFEPVGLRDDTGRWLLAAALRVRRAPGLGRGIAWAPAAPLVLTDGLPPPDGAVLAARLGALRRGVAGPEGHVLRLRFSGLAAGPAAEAAALAAGFRPSARQKSYRSALVDLARPPAALLAGLQGKWRTDLRFAQKSGLRLDRGNDPGLQARFLAMFAEVQGAKGFRPDIPPEFHFPLAGPGYGVEVLVAVRDGADVAGIVTGTAGRTVTYLFGATLPAGRPLRAGYFLTWEAMRIARDGGALWYDLGGIDPDSNPDVARFKERMNGLPVQAGVFEARPPGWRTGLILAAEALHARRRRR
jgi:hypothetical protein